jgi:hypothetical protein
MGLVARILQGLKDTPEGGATMLDNSLLVATSEFSCGVEHSSRDMPFLLAGSAGGKLRTGRHLNFNSKAATSATGYQTFQSTHNLFTSVLNAFDFEDTHFGGDKSCWRLGPLPGLT